jgi:ankyrin repeat protein
MQDIIGYTPLICASSKGYGSIVDSLIRAGASVDTQDEDGNTAFRWASIKGHGSIVDSFIQQYRFLYYNGVDPNPLRRLLTTEHWASLVPTSRALCVTTLFADNHVYMDVDSTEELVHMLFAEYYQEDSVWADIIKEIISSLHPMKLD